MGPGQGQAHRLHPLQQPHTGPPPAGAAIAAQEDGRPLRPLERPPVPVSAQQGGCPAPPALGRREPCCGARWPWGRGTHRHLSVPPVAKPKTAPTSTTPTALPDPAGKASTVSSRSPPKPSSLPRVPTPDPRVSPPDQRKDYSQSLLKPQSNFQHHVEHLLTMRLDRDIRSTEDCLARLKALEAQGRVWGQDLILHVKNQELVLSDVESKEELESYPLGSVRDCAVLLDACSYDSVLAVSVQEQAPPGTSVLLFQCDRIGVRRGPTLLPQTVLNHVLGDMELFVKQLKDALSLMGTKNKKKKKSKGGEGGSAAHHLRYPVLRECPGSRTPPSQGLPSAPCLRGSSRGAEGAPPPVTQVLDNSPNPRLAPAVEAPLLIPEAVELLEKTLHPHEYSTWKMLGIAWNKTRAEYPHSEQVPPYIPTFSDGWLPPLMLKPEQQQQVGGMGGGAARTPRCLPRFPHLALNTRPSLLPAQPFSPPPRLARAVYEFQGRNPQELSVRMGDTLEVLDQQKKWWLVQSSLGHKGYVPSNILEPLGHEDSRSQVSPPNLHMGSSPAEVTAWLKDKGFSRITVRCLGVLSGHQLLQMTPEELRAVCPEEWRRVLFKLSSVKTSLGVRPPTPPQAWGPPPARPARARPPRTPRMSQ
uniref:EPS8 signaling adaptor L3 n=1 Tax=Anser brachyrhynchus TaxID=132585 RepID=A0A8B9BLS6_9AVES